MQLLVLLPATLLVFFAGHYQHFNPSSPPILERARSAQLKKNSGGNIITAVKVNGNEIRAWIEPYASAVAFSYEDAERIGLKPETLKFDYAISTINGIVKGAGVKLDWIEVNGVGAADIEGIVLPKGAIDLSLIGKPFLNKLRSFTMEDGILFLEN